jgi:hypothetical protein
MTQEQLDDQCVRWGHDQRKVTHCQNPLCPGRPASELVALDDVPDVTDELELEDSPPPSS